MSLSIVPSNTGLADFYVQYNFPNTDSAAQRKVVLDIPGPGFGTSRLFQPDDTSGTWHLQWDLSCYRSDVQYQFKASAISCTGETAVASQSISGLAPEVAISFSPGSDGKGTVLISYNFPATSSSAQRTVGRTFTGPGFTSSEAIQPDKQQDVWAIPWDVACYPPGTYTFTATAKKCDTEAVTKSVTLTVSAKPSVAIRVIPNDDGIATVNIDYKFPGTSDASQRTVGRKFPGPGFVSEDAIHPANAQGTWSFPFDLSCYPSDASYDFTAIATSCNGEKATAATPVKGVEPKVAISFAPDANGNGFVLIDYDFTGTHASGDRLLVREFTNADGTTSSDSIRPTERTGVWRIPWSVACFPPGSYALKASAKRCGFPAVTAQTSVPVDRSPQISEFTVQPPLSPVADEQEWVLSYTMPSGSDPRWMRVYLFSYVTDSGDVHPDTLLFEQIVTENSATIRRTFTPPAGAHNGLLRAVVSNCAGVAAQNAAFTCDSCSAAPSATHNPVFLSDGNMRLSEIDPLPPLVGAAGLARTYDSSHGLHGLFGRGWGTLFDQRLLVSLIQGVETVHVSTAANDVVAFLRSGSSYTQSWPLSAQPGTLTYDVAAGAYAYRAASSTIVTLFRASDGRVSGFRDLTIGRAMSISYDAANLPTTAVDSWTGLTWRITADAAQRRIAAISVDGQPSINWQYEYDGNGNLHVVKAPGDLTWRTYDYAANRMTLARDAIGSLIESHTYDAAGRAISSHGGTEQIASIQYGLTGTTPDERLTRVTLNSGNFTDFVFKAAGGSLRTQRVIGTCTTCSGARDSTYVYDTSGRVIREQDALGYIAVTTYDAQNRISSVQQYLRPATCDPAVTASQCRLDSASLKTAAVTTTAATIIRTYTYGDPLWPDRATQITVPSVLASGQNKRDDTTYHAVSGVVVATTTTGWTGGEPARTDRGTRTAFYGDPPRVDPEGDGGETADPLAPAFNPGGTFSWMSLPQPALLRKSIDGPRTDVDDVTSFVYYPIDGSVPALWRGQLAAVRNAAGHITRFEDYDVFGRTRRAIDANDVVTEQTFDALGRAATSTTKGVAGCDTSREPLCATDLTAQRTYYGAGPLQREIRPGGGVTEYTYDEESRVDTVSRGPAVGDPRERIDYDYDPMSGNKSAERMQALADGVWVDKNRTTFGYDALGQLVTTTHADASFVMYEYDSAGRTLATRDERHSTPNTVYTYDAAGRVATVRQTLATAVGGSIATVYRYDVQGNLSAVVDPNGNTTTYRYDDFGQMLRQQSPVSGTTTYDYDAAGNLIAMTDANGASTTRTYDALSRVTRTVAARGSETDQVTWTYDTAAFGVGRAAAMSDPTGATTYAYERRGLLAAETKVIGSGSYITRYLFDADGNRSRITYPSGRIVSYGFDYAGRPASAALGSVPLVIAAVYMPFGPVSKIEYGNGTIRTTSYDQRYQPLVNALTLGGELIASHTYSHDAAGNITAISDDVDASYSRAFGYDDINRLIVANTSEALWGSGSYAYDAMGNMKSLRLGRTRNASFTYSGTLPTLVSVAENGTTKAVVYDAAGNELTFGGVAYEYSPRNFLRSQNGVTYGYDGRGLRTTTTRAARVVVLSISPSTVTGASQTQGTVTLSSAAGASGLVVTLTSSSPAAAVPATVTVAAGQSSATFAITTASVTTQVNAKITAAFNGSVASATLTIAGARFDRLRATPSVISGGDAVLGELQLESEAPEDGFVAQLASSNSSVAAVPREVTVPGGRTTVQFPITTSPVATTTEVTIAATSGDEHVSTTVTIVPPTIAELTFTPTQLRSGSLQGQVTLTGIAGSRDVVVALSSSSARIVVPPSVTISAGTRSATFGANVQPVEDATTATVTATFLDRSVTATIAIDSRALTDLAITPAVVVGGENVSAQAVIDAPAAEEGAAVSLSSTDPSLVTVPSRMTIPAGATAAAETLPTAAVSSPTPVVITATRQGVARSNTVTLTPPPVTIASLTLAKSSVVGTNLVTGTVTLTDAAPAGGVEVELSSSDIAAASLPPTITVAAGVRQGTFVIETHLVSTTTALTITAVHATTTKTAALSVLPPGGNFVSGLTVTPAFIVGGSTASAVVTLAFAANESGGAEVTLTSDTTALIVAPSVKVHNNSTSAALTVSTTSVSTPVAATISASYGGVLQRVRIVVAPQNAVTLSKLSVAPIRVNGGTTATGTVTLTGPAPYGGAIVSIETRRRNMITVPQSVTIPEGSAGATFVIGTQLVNGKHDKLVELVATYNGISASATLAISSPTVVDLHPQTVALCASFTVAPCLIIDALAATAAAAATIYETQYTLFTPELTLLAETAAAVESGPSVAYEYVWFAGQPLVQIDAASGDIAYYLSDHLGTPILQVSSTARVVWEPQFDPYGSVASFGRGEARHQPLRLPGQTANDDGDLYQNVFRWYRPTVGRFSQDDPLAHDPLAMQPAARARAIAEAFMYASGNPNSKIDPTGLCPCNQRCESGAWGYIDRSIAVGILFGRQWGQVTFFCNGSTLRCSYSYACTTIGVQGGASAGFGAGFVGGSGCKCAGNLPNSDSLSLGIYRNFGTQISNAPCRGLGLGWGLGVGGAYVVGAQCQNTTPVTCTGR
ncbi:MAG TPA: RHS repeat-associated core domain-containing protein [Thermoanaerobaculia bacterium]|nr:RHS repeat-associated core domain-containing protein [Thermoanaerobaculia bacterium]